MSNHAKIENAIPTSSEAQQALDAPETAGPIDLPTPNETAVTGGGDAGAYGGSFRLNHNEPTNEDEDESDEPEQPSPTDLPVVGEDVTGGGDGGTYGGSIRLNHNEPTVEDDEAAPPAPVDLPTQDDDQVKGGPLGLGGFGGSDRLNHNENLAADGDECGGAWPG